jgi:hypothetical protein
MYRDDRGWKPLPQKLNLLALVSSSVGAPPGQGRDWIAAGAYSAEVQATKAGSRSCNDETCFELVSKPRIALRPEAPLGRRFPAGSARGCFQQAFPDMEKRETGSTAH